MKINILLDTEDSFLHDYTEDLIRKIKKIGHEVYFSKDHKKIQRGDILFLLGCKTILTKKHLALNKNNIVVHPSKLPKGRGSAALVWEILKGENEIFITLFEANEDIDKGDIYLQESIRFNGYELSDEIRRIQALKTMELVLKYVKAHKKLISKKQIGKGSYYRKRTIKDSELNIDKSLREQFNHLRVVDNKRYPAYFIYKNNKYILKIFRQED
tara:strand:+ start:44 stop:685 length:642 start_codon:yes stop_codon:yes gene_type:complete